ncbi:MAG: tRNA (adenosine(37)-N6)-threonylcarbamoyltransferase complex dimerization subunit type 1 TsaB [bacterium]
MLLLAIDTSTWAGSIALFDDQSGIIAEYCLINTVTHSERLLGSIDLVLGQAQSKLDDIDVLAATVGPGSFTGLRIGVSTIKGLAYASQKKIASVSTLEVMARAFPFIPAIICPLMDAKKKEVFTCLYKWQEDTLVPLMPESCVKPASLVSKIKALESDVIFVGDGLDIYGTMLRDELQDRVKMAPSVFFYPRAAIVALLGCEYAKAGKLSDPADVVPRYLRASDAELHFKG